EGVEGPNLAAEALARVRSAIEEAGAALGPQAVTIDKRIPVAAGLAGGSADAAAVLRVADRLAGEPLGDDALMAIAAGLGSDVPSQVRPAPALVRGTGATVEAAGLPLLNLVLVPQPRGLATGDVYAELDRLRTEGAVPAREVLDPAPLRQLAASGALALAEGLENDLEAAALSLRPELTQALDALAGAGALGARISGSGPTAFGVFADADAAARAAAGIERAMAVTTVAA
ncbi:MAG: 4-(cytidine 5'-diphospho)-2-C-methyl-D-erythritol kinase, partial [Solirubrobacterales bacterium]